MDRLRTLVAAALMIPGVGMLILPILQNPHEASPFGHDWWLWAFALLLLGAGLLPEERN